MTVGFPLFKRAFTPAASPPPLQPRENQCLTESMSMRSIVALVCRVHTNVRQNISPLPELAVVSRSHRQRWWLVWRRTPRLGRTSLQLEL